MEILIDGITKLETKLSLSEIAEKIANNICEVNEGNTLVNWRNVTTIVVL